MQLKEYKINVKLKLAALWTAVMFCYVYGDFFFLFVPGRIENLMQGSSGAGDTTPLKILIFAIMMTIPSLMIIFSVFLRSTLNRLLNIIFSIIFTIIMVLVVATTLGEWMVFYTYMGIVEIIITLAIAAVAIKWPREDCV